MRGPNLTPKTAVFRGKWFARNVTTTYENGWLWTRRPLARTHLATGKKRRFTTLQDRLSGGGLSGIQFVDLIDGRAEFLVGDDFSLRIYELPNKK